MDKAERGSIDKSNNHYAEDHSYKSRLLTAPDVSGIFNISSAAAYELIQQRKISSALIYRNVRLRPDNLEKFIFQPSI